MKILLFQINQQKICQKRLEYNLFTNIRISKYVQQQIYFQHIWGINLLAKFNCPNMSELLYFLRFIRMNNFGTIKADNVKDLHCKNIAISFINVRILAI